jgi:Mor family transcriptional regulator
MSISVKDILLRNQEEIVRDYLAGTSTCELGRRFGVSNASIYIFLRDVKGVEIRKVTSLEDYKEDMTTLYNSGLPISSIAKQLNLNNSTCQRYAQQLGFDTKKFKKTRDIPLSVNTDEIIQDYNKGLGCSILSRKYNCAEGSIITLLRNNNITIRPIRTLFFNEHFFDKIETFSQAYLLGLLDADGSISIKQHSVTLSMIDYEPIEYFAKCVDYPVNNIKVKRFEEPNIKTQYGIKLCSTHMVESMLHNVKTQDKTHCLKFPTSDIVSENLFPALLLGFCDGDGSIMIKNTNGSKTLVVTYIGTMPMIEGIKKIVDKYVGVYSKLNYKPAKTSSPMARIMMCGQKNALPFLDYIYKDHEFCLPRKYNRYQEMKEYYEQRREEKAAKYKI